MNHTVKIRLVSLFCVCLLLLAGCHRNPAPQPEPPEPPDQSVSPLPPEDGGQQNESGIQVESDFFSGEQKSDQGKQLLSWSISIPKVLLQGEPMMNIGNYYDNYKEKRLLSLEEDLLPLARQRLEDGVLLAAFEVEEDFAVARNSGNVLSIRRARWQYSGGAHESVEEKAETWLLRDGDCYLLLLEDLLPDVPDPRQFVLQQVMETARQQAEENPDLFYENYQEAIEQTWQPEDFYLTENSLGLIFQEYAIAPYTAGVVTFEIPFSQLGDNLMEELRP